MDGGEAIGDKMAENVLTNLDNGEVVQLNNNIRVEFLAQRVLCYVTCQSVLRYLSHSQNLPVTHSYLS